MANNHFPPVFGPSGFAPTLQTFGQNPTDFPIGPFPIGPLHAPHLLDYTAHSAVTPPDTPLSGSYSRTSDTPLSSTYPRTPFPDLHLGGSFPSGSFFPSAVPCETPNLCLPSLPGQPWNFSVNEQLFLPYLSHKAAPFNWDLFNSRSHPAVQNRSSVGQQVQSHARSVDKSELDSFPRFTPSLGISQTVAHLKSSGWYSIRSNSPSTKDNLGSVNSTGSNTDQGSCGDSQSMSCPESAKRNGEKIKDEITNGEDAQSYVGDPGAPHTREPKPTGAGDPGQSSTGESSESRTGGSGQETACVTSSETPPVGDGAMGKRRTRKRPATGSCSGPNSDRSSCPVCGLSLAYLRTNGSSSRDWGDNCSLCQHLLEEEARLESLYNKPLNLSRPKRARSSRRDTNSPLGALPDRSNRCSQITRQLRERNAAGRAVAPEESEPMQTSSGSQAEEPSGGRTGPGEASSSGTCCPVCMCALSGTYEEMTFHVELCLNKSQAEQEVGSTQSNGGDLGDRPAPAEQDDGEPDSDLDVYDWADGRRVRVNIMSGSSLAAAAGFTLVGRETDDNEALVVDDDESDMFGKPQFSEVDVIPCASDESTEAQERRALRGALLGDDNPGSIPSTSTSDKWTEETPGSSKWTEETPGSSKWTEETPGSSKWTEETPGSSKAVNTEAAAASSAPAAKCLICMDNYEQPLVSTQCWHVHCKECWMRALGAMKLCPQCKTITSSAHLRRIYL